MWRRASHSRPLEAREPSGPTRVRRVHPCSESLRPRGGPRGARGEINLARSSRPERRCSTRQPRGRWLLDPPPRTAHGTLRHLRSSLGNRPCTRSFHSWSATRLSLLGGPPATALGTNRDGLPRSGESRSRTRLRHPSSRPERPTQRARGDSSQTPRCRSGCRLQHRTGRPRRPASMRPSGRDRSFAMVAGMMQQVRGSLARCHCPQS